MKVKESRGEVEVGVEVLGVGVERKSRSSSTAEARN